MNGCKQQVAEPLTLDLKRSRYRELVTAEGWDTQDQQAEGLGLGQATISRVVNRGTRPGPSVIAALLATFPDEPFEDLFEIVPDTSGRRAA